METLNSIFTRRSIRKYTDRSVGEEQIETILRAAMAAPSAGNQQPWHFVVIDDRNTMIKITEFHPYSNMLNHAPVAIAICAELTLERFEGYWVQDCAAATQNILVAAHGLGLGAVWLGIHPQEERMDGLRKLLHLPDHVMPLAVVAIGYPAEKKEKADRYQANRIHMNKW